MELAQSFDELTYRPNTYRNSDAMELGAAEVRTCWICKGAGLVWRRCPNKKEHPCARCHKVGHPVNTCRTAAARQGRSA
jgi:hypothetical protein